MSRYAARVVRHPVLHDRIAAGILDTAAAVLADRQGETVSMAEIAEAAGVGRATLYRYFPNRDALITGLTRAAIDELSERVADADVATAGAITALTRLTRGFLASGNKYVALWSHGKRSADIAEIDSRLAEPVRGLMRRAVADGTLRDDVPAAVQFEIYTALLERGLDLLRRKEISVEQGTELILTLFLDGARRR